MANSGTHLLVLYDDTGTITGVGQINQEEVELQGGKGAQVYVTSANRHFARLELPTDMRSLTNEENHGSVRHLASPAERTSPSVGTPCGNESKNHA
jgi:hypothetical protein